MSMVHFGKVITGKLTFVGLDHSWGTIPDDNKLNICTSQSVQINALTDMIHIILIRRTPTQTNLSSTTPILTRYEFGPRTKNVESHKQLSSSL